MGCHAPSEDVEDDGEFLAANLEDDAALAAELLIRLSRSDTHLPWRHLSEHPDPLAAPQPAPAAVTGTWGKRRARSTPLAAEGPRRGSPATPLSWSAGSGSGSEDGESSRPPRPAAEPEAVAAHGGEQIGAPPAKRPRAEPYERGARGAVVGAPQAGGSPAGSASKETAVVEATARDQAPPRSAVHVEPLRLRSTSHRANSVAIRRQGKKMELGKRKEIYHALLEENMALNKLESNSLSRTVNKRVVTPLSKKAKSEEPQHMQSTSDFRELKGPAGTASLVVEEDNPDQLQCTRSFSSAQAQLLPFDLNCLPDIDL